MLTKCKEHTITSGMQIEGHNRTRNEKILKPMINDNCSETTSSPRSGDDFSKGKIFKQVNLSKESSIAPIKISINLNSNEENKSKDYFIGSTKLPTKSNHPFDQVNKTNENLCNLSKTSDGPTSLPICVYPHKQNNYSKNKKVSKDPPIPKGNNFYALAKKAECIQKNNDLAEFYYCQAISNNVRAESAIKDLASLLHKLGKTDQSCKLLEDNKEKFIEDIEKYDNLLSTFKKQLVATPNMQNKNLKISGLPVNCTESSIRSLFTNSTRIAEINFNSEKVLGKSNFYCILMFNSHSSARKTLEGFSAWNKYKVHWISVSGNVVCDAHYALNKIENCRKVNPSFSSKLFDRDPDGFIYSMPIDYSQNTILEIPEEITGDLAGVLGVDLFTTIFENL